MPGAMVSISSGHRREPAQGDPETERRAPLVRGTLLGRLSANELHSGFAGLGLDPLDSNRAFRAGGVGRDDVARINVALESSGEGGRDGLAALLEQELVGFSSRVATHACRGGSCRSSPSGRRRCRPSCPAPTGPPGECSPPLRASLAGVHDLASAGVLAAVIENPDLGAALGEQLIDPVAALPAGAEILASVSEWLGSGMRVDPAAERLFVHPNTIRYRLRRYEELI